MEILCRLCLKDLRLDSTSVQLMFCQAFKDNSPRFHVFLQICQLFSSDIVNNLMQRICSSCDDALLSTAIFVENCLKSEEYFKTDIKFGTNLADKDNYNQELIAEPMIEVHVGKEESNAEQSGVRTRHSIKYSNDPFGNSRKIEISDRESFQCDDCSSTFGKKTELRRHVKEHSKSFLCHCGKAYNLLSRLKKHQFRVHSKRTLQCNECGKGFKSAYSLKHHQNIHRSVKPFQCNSCSESYYYPSSLKQHIERTHSLIKVEYDRPKKRFLCDNCGESFSRQYHLKRHRRNRHEGKVSLDFPCETCGKAFTDRDRLISHMHIHTDERKYKCTDCDKGFRQRVYLQDHMNRVHLNVRPFPCSTCDRAFKTKSHLEKHIRTHTGEKPFSCPLCTYFSAERSNLTKHLKIHNRLPIIDAIKEPTIVGNLVIL